MIFTRIDVKLAFDMGKPANHGNEYPLHTARGKRASDWNRAVGTQTIAKSLLPKPLRTDCI